MRHGEHVPQPNPEAALSENWLVDLTRQIRGWDSSVERQGSTFVVSDQYAWIQPHEHLTKTGHLAGASRSIVEASRRTYERLRQDERFELEPMHGGGSQPSIVARLKVPVDGIDTLIVQYSKSQ